MFFIKEQNRSFKIKRGWVKLKKNTQEYEMFGELYTECGVVPSFRFPKKRYLNHRLDGEPKKREKNYKLYKL